jgi:signal transduction histidine kinase
MVRKFKLRDQLALIGAVPMLLATVAAVLLAADGSSGARPFGLVLLGAVVVSAGVVVLIIRTILATVSSMADQVETMVRAHRAHRPGDADLERLVPLRTVQDGEIGRLASAINGVHRAAVDGGRGQQEAMRAGLSSIVVNLAKRNRTLLDRQIEQLDHLEGTEEDPERLGHLFKVDHLATRMRRNAESLLVLADADPGLRRGHPVEVAQVLRVAIGEVEAYQQIELAGVQRALLPPAAAADLAHLAAELMENATQFSPPTSPVVVTGTDDGCGRYRVEVADQGIGLAPDQLEETNRLLAASPELNLDMGRSLGFMVVGRLAARLGATVVLEQNGASGCRAVISLPKLLFVNDEFVDSAPSAAVVGEPVQGVDMLSTLKGTATAPVAAPAVTPTVAAATPASAPAPTGNPVATGAATATPAAPPPLPTRGQRPPAPQISGARQIPAPPQPPSDTQSLDRADDSVSARPPVPTRDPASDPTTYPTTDPGLFAWPSAPARGDSATPPVGDAGPARLEQALPAGNAFEDGVASLLAPNQTEAGLTRRRRSPETGGAYPAAPDARPVPTGRRDPEEIKNRLSRYRQGLKGHRPVPQSTTESSEPNEPGSTTPEGSGRS